MSHLQFDQDQNNNFTLTEKYQEQQNSYSSKNSLFQDKYPFSKKEKIEKLEQMENVNANKGIHSILEGIDQSIQIKILNLDEKIMDEEDKTFKKIIDDLFSQNDKLKKYECWKYMICKELLKKNYILEKYLNSGGQADIFDGYFQNKGIKEQYVFKIYFDATNKQFQEEIDIMKSFEKPINVVKIIDSLQIEQFYILILEKCEYSLKHQLKLFQDRKLIFCINNLLKIVFDLLDGLIQFRIYNILHLDIKPGNILISQKGNYCYSDFGTSLNIKKNEEIEVISITKYYASPEQLMKFQQIDAQSINSINFQSDVYSLGKTLQKVIDIFKEVNKQNEDLEIIQNFEKIIDENMIQPVIQQRSKCQNLHKQFLKQFKVIDYPHFLINYQIKLKKIIKLSIFDQNKDMPYFFELSLQYNLINLDLINNYLERFQQINSNKYNELSQGLLEMLQLKKQIFQGLYSDYDIVQSLNNVGLCYQNLGDYQNSLKYYLQSLEMTKQIFKGNNSIIAKSLNNVGQCYKNLGDNQNGLKYSLESLEMREYMNQGNDPDFALSLNSVGSCYQNLGQYQKGLEYFFQSLIIIKQNYEGNHPSVASLLNNVGLCFHKLGDNKQGLKYLLESLHMDKQIFHGNTPNIATCLHNIGLCYNSLGDNLNGLKYSLTSLEMRKCIFPGNHPDIATSLNNVQVNFFELSDYQNGLKYSLELLGMMKQTFQGNHPRIAKNLNDVGFCYKNLGKHQKSLIYSLESLIMKKYIFKGNHLDVAESINNVAVCYHNLGDIQKELKYQLKQLVMRKQIFEGNHQKISMNLNNVGQCYKTLGDNQKSLKYSFESLVLLKQIFKGNHPDTSTVINNVGLCYQDFGDNQKGLKYLLKSLEMRKQIFHRYHPQIATSLNNVGQCYQKLGDHQNALKYYFESLSLQNII